MMLKFSSVQKNKKRIVYVHLIRIFIIFSEVGTMSKIKYLSFVFLQEIFIEHI